jgi:hypothetical protein
VLGSVLGKEVRPSVTGLLTTCANPSRKVFIDPIRNEKLGILRPSVTAFGETDLIVAERFAMGGGGVLLVRGTVPDVAVQHDERGTALRIFEDLESVLDPVNVVRIADPQNVPPITQEPSCDVLCKGNPRAPFNGNVIVVIDPAEIVKPKMGGQRCRFGRNALHQTAVSANGINVVIKNLKARPVVTVGEPLLGDAHSDARGNTLPQWTSRGLNA